MVSPEAVAQVQLDGHNFLKECPVFRKQKEILLSFICSPLIKNQNHLHTCLLFTKKGRFWAALIHAIHILTLHPLSIHPCVKDLQNNQYIKGELLSSLLNIKNDIFVFLTH